MKKSFVFPLVLLFCAITGLSGCGAGAVSKQAADHDAKGLDPFAYGDEFALRPAASAVKPVAAAKAEPVKKAAAEERKTVSGTVAAVPPADSAVVSAPVAAKAPSGGKVYRVQIGIFEERKSADQRAGDARAKVTDPVYVEFEPPFYRVRVGDYITREEAEQQVKVLQNLGFRGSFWVVKNMGTP